MDSSTLTTSLSEGPQGGVAPRHGSAPLRLLVEGWRHFPHSYSIVNQQQCLELLRRPDVALAHRNAPVPPYLHSPVLGVLDREDEDRIHAMPDPVPGQEFDAVYRINYPYDFGPSACERVFVFATCERMLMRSVDVLGPPTVKPGAMARSFPQRITDNNITVVTPSAWSKAGMERSGIDPARIVVVPHGVNPDIFKPVDPEARERTRAERGFANTFTFLHVSAMTGNKNIEGVIRAFLATVRKYPHARLVLKGLSELFMSDKWISQELGRLGPADRDLARRTISYCGLTMKVRDQVALYQTADAYVAPYQSEGFCIPVLEAAACGLPVIVSAGGPTDEFTDERFALRVATEIGDHCHDGTIWLKADPKSLEAQMERAITDHHWRNLAGEFGPAAVRQRHTWKSVVEQLLDLVRVPAHSER